MISDKAILVVIISFLLSACGASKASDNEQTYYHAAKLNSLKAEDYYIVNRDMAGFASSSQHGDISFELAGKLADIRVDVGSKVQEGDTLATLDTELLGIEKQEVSAQFAESKARLKLNQSSLKRQKSLGKEGYASQQRLDELLADQDTIKAGMARLDAALQSIETRIRKSSLLAPYDGTVSARYVDIGTVTNAGTPIIKLLNDTKMEAKIGVPARLLAMLTPGSQQQLSIDGQQIDSQVIAVGADISPITRTVPIRLELPKLSTVVDGSLVKLKIHEKVQKPGYWVPLSALTDGMRGLWTIYAALSENGEIAGNQIYRIEARAVQIEYTKDNNAYITADLHDVEQYIVGGLHRFVPGQKVKSGSIETPSL